ncbi:MAG: hypothetical protein IPO58_00910 [Betaproteobacteria bacterium]|nr:hypothetical protein [Betaproteobacteria bacterium]
MDWTRGRAPAPMPVAVSLSAAVPATATARRLLQVAAAAALCVALALLGGCSALRLGYHQADWVAFRWLDNYADFDDAQAARVREALKSWLAWHRRTQLADYAEFLMRVDAEVPADTSAERVCALWGEVRTRVDRSVAQALPAIADIGRTLKPAQLAHIEQRYAKTEAEFREEYMQQNPARRRDDALERLVDRAESFYGDLDAQQKERLERWVAESPFDPGMTLAERRRRQQDALQTLRRLIVEPDSAAGRSQIQAWIERFGRSPREAHRLYAERVLQHNCKVTADLHNRATAAQRQYLSKKLRGWAADLRALASETAD